MFVRPLTFLYYSSMLVAASHLLSLLIFLPQWRPLVWRTPLQWRYNIGLLLCTSLLPFVCWLNIGCVLCLKYTWWFYLPYCAICWLSETESQGGIPLQWLRESEAVEQLSDFFPSKISRHNEALRTSDENVYIFGYHPHGIFGWGCLLNFCGYSKDVKDVFDGVQIRVATLNFNLRVPFLRHALLFFGCISCSSSSLLNFLNQRNGNAVVVVVGGAKEANYSGVEGKVVLENRYGLFKLALQAGAVLIPMYCFGESLLYRMENPEEYLFLENLSNFTKKYFGFVVPCFFGRGLFQDRFGWIPHQRPLNLVIGNPIPCAKIENPTISDITEVKEKYAVALRTIFNDHKHLHCDYSDNLNLTIT